MTWLACSGPIQCPWAPEPKLTLLTFSCFHFATLSYTLSVVGTSACVCCVLSPPRSSLTIVFVSALFLIRTMLYRKDQLELN